MKFLTVFIAVSLSAAGCTASSEEPTQTQESKLLDEGSNEPTDGTLHADCYDACVKAEWATAKRCENKCTY